MYFGNIKKNDIANGKGVRVTLFVSGCTNHCKIVSSQKHGTLIMVSLIQRKQKMRLLML